MSAKLRSQCAVAGCKGKARARGLCNACYLRGWRKDELQIHPRRQRVPLVKHDIYVSAELDRKLLKLQRASGLNVSQIARAALEKHLADVQIATAASPTQSDPG